MRDLTEVLSAYTDHPMQNGDAVLFCDPNVCLEATELADQWDPVVRRNLAAALRNSTRQVQLGISRPDAVLLPSDHALWADLREELLGDVELLPLLALPAA